MELQAVLFDLDGVITDTAEFHYVAWKKLGEEIGIPFDREFNDNLKGVSRMESLELILRLGGKENDFTQEEKNALAAKKNEHYVSLLDQLKPTDTYPAIRELLEELRGAGIPAVVASASKNAPQILRALELETFFDFVVPPDSVERGKPAPDLFLRGAEVVGAKPNACIGIEDAQAGVEAIKAAGMKAVGIGNESKLTASGADIVLPNTTELSLDFLHKQI